MPEQAGPGPDITDKSILSKEEFSVAYLAENPNAIQDKDDAHVVADGVNPHRLDVLSHKSSSAELVNKGLHGVGDESGPAMLNKAEEQVSEAEKSFEAAGELGKVMEEMISRLDELAQKASLLESTTAKDLINDNISGARGFLDKVGADGYESGPVMIANANKLIDQAKTTFSQAEADELRANEIRDRISKLN